jgi:hypothetical protein
MRNRPGRFLVPICVFLGSAVLVLGLRIGISSAFNAIEASRTTPPARHAQLGPVPISPQIEQQWGVRVTLVQLLADRGLVEMRYMVVDPTKAARLHADSNSLTNIPWIKVEGTDLSIKSRSVMYHFQHGVGQGVEGNTYSIIYGNANNAVHPSSFVTIVMPDGLELQHVPVGG